MKYGQRCFWLIRYLFNFETYLPKWTRWDTNVMEKIAVLKTSKRTFKIPIRPRTSQTSQKPSLSNINHEELKQIKNDTVPMIPLTPCAALSTHGCPLSYERSTKSILVVLLSIWWLSLFQVYSVIQKIILD